MLREGQTSGRNLAEEPAPPSQVETRPLMLSRYLALETADEDWVTIFHRLTAARLRVSRAVYEWLLTFERSRPAPDPSDPASQRRIKLLSNKGFLVHAGDSDGASTARRLASVVPRLFNCPASDRARSGDVVVLGIPYDGGARAPVDSRAAPAAIRQQSLAFDYTTDFRTGRPMGWHDADSGRRVLEGVRISDSGNVFVQAGESQTTLFGRIETVVEDLTRDGALLAVLGGDPSVIFPVIRKLQDARPLDVAVLGADCGFDVDVLNGGVNAANVAHRLSELPHVGTIFHLGGRGFASRSGGHLRQNLPHQLPAHACTGLGVATLLGRGPEVPLFLILDMDVLDPTYAPTRTRPVPGGLSFEALKDVLDGLGRTRAIAGLALVGMEPARDVGPLSAVMACHLLLAMLTAAVNAA